MIVTFVHVWVKEGFREAFIEASSINHRTSVQEPGNLRFDLLQDARNPNKFVLYEAYESEELAVAHKSTRHYLTWKETVADMMAKPREGKKHIILAPLEKSKW